jgi:hypothetical protein
LYAALSIAYNKPSVNHPWSGWLLATSRKNSGVALLMRLWNGQNVKKPTIPVLLIELDCPIGTYGALEKRQRAILQPDAPRERVCHAVSERTLLCRLGCIPNYRE